MPEFKVVLKRTDFAYVNVEAKDEDDAINEAYNMAPDLCIHCSGTPHDPFSVDGGEWEEESVEEVG